MLSEVFGDVFRLFTPRQSKSPPIAHRLEFRLTRQTPASEIAILFRARRNACNPKGRWEKLGRASGQRRINCLENR